MSEALPPIGERPAVLVLNGAGVDKLPWQDELLRPGDMKSTLNELGCELQIGYVHDEPGQGDRRPERLLIARNPSFNAANELTSATFETHELPDSAAIVDRWAANYFVVRTVGGLEQYVAQGIGVSPEDVWN